MRRFAALTLIALCLALPASAAPLKGDYQAGTEAHGRGDFKAALEQWQPMAEAGDRRAQYAIGFMYQFGQGVPLDYKKAFEYFEMAARQNDTDAQYALGMLLEQGLGTGRRDYRAALEWYVRAADGGGNPNADFAAGRMYFRALGTNRNLGAAFERFRKAALQGHPAAQYALGSMFEVGTETIPENPAQAWFWYSMAAKTDPKVLAEYDPAYRPQVALQGLKERISAPELKLAEDWVRRGAMEEALKSMAPIAPVPRSDKEGVERRDRRG